MPLQYQLITLGPNADLFDHRIRQELFDGFRDLDLDPASDLAILGAHQRSQLNAKCSMIGLWYGGDSPFVGEVEHIEALESLLAMGVAPLPLVESLEVFTKKIPKSLQSINGIAWDDARLIGDILKAFGLTRELRQAFISYKRSDSAGIARQLAHTLFDRGYQVFLDTASVERGVAFQEVLHDRLANIDLVVLLDSPHALDSVWVHEELDMVNQLGLGVLQLAWTVPDPGDPSGVRLLATPGTEFSFRYGLEPRHFKDPSHTIGPDARLNDEALKEIADCAEQGASAPLAPGGFGLYRTYERKHPDWTWRSMSNRRARWRSSGKARSSPRLCRSSGCPTPRSFTSRRGGSARGRAARRPFVTSAPAEYSSTVWGFSMSGSSS